MDKINITDFQTFAAVAREVAPLAQGRLNPGGSRDTRLTKICAIAQIMIEFSACSVKYVRSRRYCLSVRFLPLICAIALIE
ncbi:hypothetical protein [Isoalcanivorax pacificus]|uniref:hypothetical protein n=1 Tax=Isoalcanivorax pacificus TaxID=1306787 RepID=UPI00030E55A2|nr:hypothetical protein [Isoalcanivorax pacificus]